MGKEHRYSLWPKNSHHCDEKPQIISDKSETPQVTDMEYHPQKTSQTIQDRG